MNRFVRCPKTRLLSPGSLLAATAWLAVAALWPASADALTVNVNLDSNTSRTDLVGPAGGSGQTWNQKSSKSASGLLDSAGGSTGIGYTFDIGSDPGTWATTGLSMLRGASYTEANQTTTLAITGLNPAKTYDLYLASYGTYNNGNWTARFSTTNTTPTSSPQIVTQSGNGSAWQLGENYASFISMVPDATGKITVTRISLTGYCWFNGFQLVETLPGAAMLTFGLPGNPAVITGTNITWTVPNGTNVSNLAPTFTLLPGATCVPVSGTPRDFTSPQTYTVTSSDSVNTNTYTVTVVVAPPLQVNVNLDGGTRTGLGGPAGGSGQTWNQLNTASANGLLDYAGNISTLGFTLSNPGYFGSWGGPSLSLLTGAYFLGGPTSFKLVLTGLNPVKTYDLYLPSYSAYGDGMWNMSFTTSNTTPTASPQMVVGSGNGSTWVEGDNYAHFSSVVPDATGQITVSMSGMGAYEFLNGFQILQTGAVPPQADILTFGLPGNPASINGTQITLTVPYGTDVTQLAPTFTLSPGATCNPVSGTPRNFSTPQIYTVTFADPLITKTYTVTVDVLDLPNQSVNVNLDGSTSRTGLVGPTGGSGKTWNQFNTPSAGNLLNVDNVQTTVGFTLGAGYFGSWGTPGLSLLDGAYYLGGSTPSSLVITGLAPSRKYDLYLASYSAYGNGLWNMSFSTSNPTSTTSPQTVNSTAANGSNWVQGANYARFTNMTPDATGKITVSMSGTGAYEFFNGFQLVDITPQAIIKTFTFPTYGAATILGTSIIITVPYGTNLTALAPTYTLSDGASCVPASGSSQNFTSPVHYGVTASDSTTKNHTVTVNTRPIADPEFTLTAPAAWDGRQTITVQSTITNQALLEATGGTHVNYHWSVAGVAVTKQITPGTLTLTRSQGSGPMTVTLTMDNGGFAISHSVTVNVQQPANDAWVQRTPDANEKPVTGQFFARDDTGKGTICYNGTVSGTPDSVYLKVYKTPNGGTEVLDSTTTMNQPFAGGAYALSAKIDAGLATCRVEFGTTTGGADTLVDNTVTNLVCGDAYIIEGQSNAEATAPGTDVTGYSSPWIRTYVGGWGNAVRQGTNWIGYWGMDLAIELLADYNVPICIINGAVGGTRIDQHQPNPANHTVGGGGLYSIYANLYNRVVAAKLTHGIRAVLWHQGEQDQGSQGPFNGDYDYKFYQQYFVDMSAAWKQDYPNIRNYYVFQIWPYACGDTSRNDQLREAQRTLPYLFSNMLIMSTLGIVPGSSCHYEPAGYQKFSDLISLLVEQDIYGYMPGAVFTAPDLKKAYFTTEAQNEIALEFAQTMAPWIDATKGLFYLDGVPNKVASGSASGKVIKLQLNAPSTANTLTYLQGTEWAAAGSIQATLLHGANGIAALTFADVPISTSTTVSYGSWIGTKSLSGAAAAGDADPDHDGVQNALEYVLGGEPNPAAAGSNSAALLPHPTHNTEGDLVFTFRRKIASVGGVSLAFKWSTDLTFPTLNTVPIGAAGSTSDGINVAITSYDAATDTIIVTVPAAKATGGKLFGRLHATVP
ncbi:MAG: hypothetical protein NTW21_25495 [Verrucomicrobia bacterium]|nr:hypothetical protein [Verrucomicrobiota bacterium]